MARGRERDEPPDILSVKELKELRHQIAHLARTVSGESMRPRLKRAG
jgi:hypothetical protein